MNSVHIIGNFTKEVELQYSTSGSAYVKNTVAVKRKFKKEETDFVPVTFFGKSAELIAQYCYKGSKIAITGRLQIDNVQKDNEWKTYVSVIADEFEFLSSKKQESAVTEAPSPQESVFDPFEKEQAPIDVSDSDLPF